MRKRAHSDNKFNLALLFLRVSCFIIFALFCIQLIFRLYIPGKTTTHNLNDLLFFN